MRIYQRGGDTWGFSYGLGGLSVLAVIALGFIGMAFRYAWFVLIPLIVWVVVKAVTDWCRRYQAQEQACRIHDAEHTPASVEGCHFCHLELAELAYRERCEREQDAQAVEAARLRAKYQA